MSGRASAVQMTSARNHTTHNGQEQTSSERFAALVFTRAAMRKLLPGRVYNDLVAAMDGRGKIDPAHADTIAEAMKDWAMSHGATHFTHWFQPLTGATAEKHDSFIEWSGDERVIERFSGKSLIQGEPDASSFPSGGLRTTWEARGHTGWDPTSPPFLWKGGDGMTLCIPSIFFSYNGDVLDTKIPLLRSEREIAQAVMRLFRHTGTRAERVFCTLGWEQEYFVVDRRLRNLRPDLVMLGRTLYGAVPPKHQQLEDHYLGAVKDRILSYMQDFETAALQLGIPLKTRHNEVAPAQHEAAPVYARGPLSSDQNILLMELMRQIAVQHDLACLLHEKPFAGINGSGKHLNWSLATDGGINLLDPTDTPEKSIQFLLLLTAFLQAVHRHADLLRASIASPGNDFRLGAHEAPPAIISVYLGDALERLLDDIEAKGSYESGGKGSPYSFGLPVIPDMPKENTDRNRTSPLAFTGNKFEFRAAGAWSSCAWPITVLNVIVAESLNELLDQIEGHLGGAAEGAPFAAAAIPVIRDSLKQSRLIRFSGNNYSTEWQEEAARRGLPNVHTAPEAYQALLTEKALRAFNGILTGSELKSRHDIGADEYSKTVDIEGQLMLEIFRTQLLPAALKYQKLMASGVSALGREVPMQGKLLGRLTDRIEKAIELTDGIEEALARARATAEHDRAMAYCTQVRPACAAAREVVDQIEQLVDDEVWPLPKYWEILFLV
jgi:glutamine synthetase